MHQWHPQVQRVWRCHPRPPQQSARTSVLDLRLGISPRLGSGSAEGMDFLTKAHYGRGLPPNAEGRLLGMATSSDAAGMVKALRRVLREWRLRRGGMRQSRFSREAGGSSQGRAEDTPRPRPQKRGHKGEVGARVGKGQQWGSEKLSQQSTHTNQGECARP